MKRFLFAAALAAILVASREVLREYYYDATDDENEPVEDDDVCPTCGNFVNFSWRMTDAWRMQHLCPDCFLQYLLNRTKK